MNFPAINPPWSIFQPPEDEESEDEEEPAEDSQSLGCSMGIPQARWMVEFMKHPIQMDDLGVPPF